MRIDETNEFYHQGGIYVHEIYHMDENYSIGDIEIWIMKGITWITFIVENDNHL